MKRIWAYFLVTAVMISMISSTAPGQDDGWKTLYTEGNGLIKNGKFFEAESLFVRIVEQDRKNPYGHIGLGRIYDIYRPGSRTAIKTLEKATRLDPDLAEAYYYLAQVYQNTGRRPLEAIRNFRKAVRRDSSNVKYWIALANMEGYWNPLEKVKVLGNALKVHPNDPQIFNLFVEAALWHSKGKKGAKALEALIELDPENTIFVWGLIRMHYGARAYEKGLEAIEKYSPVLKTESRSQAAFYHAKMFFGLDRAEEALKFYKRAIESIQDLKDGETIFSDISYIINDDEYQKLLNLPADSLPRFYQRFWRSRDPNLATVENERIVEHYSRLHYAMREYRTSVSDHNYLDFMRATTHPANRDDELMPVNIGLEALNEQMRFAFSLAIPEKKEIDDLGVIYIRHGKPDNAITDAEVDVQNLTWHYHKRFNRPEMIFHFSRQGGASGWRMDALPVSFRNRWTLGSKYALFDPSLPVRPDIDPTERENVLKKLAGENIQHTRTGMQIESTGFRYDKEPLEFPYQMLAFKGPETTTRIDLFYGLSGSAFAPDTVSANPKLNFHKFIGFYSPVFDEIVGIRRDEQRILPGSHSSWKEQSFVDLEGFSVNPGKYSFVLQLQDNVSERLAVYQGTLTVPDYHQPLLLMSDILVSDPIPAEKASDRFRKEDIPYSPRMFTSFTTGRILGLYYEVYNLYLDTNGLTHFRISWSLQSEGAESTSPLKVLFNRIIGKDQYKVTSAYDYRGNSRDEKLYTNVDLGNVEPGNYHALITVEDLVSGDKVEKKALIRVE